MTPAPSVEEWLNRWRVVEERRALVARALEEGGARVVRDEPPCTLRVMTEAERTQRPRAFTVNPSAPVFVTALRVDPYRAKKRRRDE